MGARRRAPAVMCAMNRIDMSKYSSPLGRANRVARALWRAVWLLLFRPTPVPMFGWRNFLLRAFGARMGRGVHVYPSCRIWAPWHLAMGDYSCLSFGVDCYCVDKVSIGPHAMVSQYAFLCTATHDDSDPHMRLVTAPITVADQAWVCAGAFVGPGVTVGQGAVLGARSSAVRDIEPWKVCAGSPARVLRDRTVREPGQPEGAAGTAAG